MQAETVLTARQQEIWHFLVEYVDGHGYPPTVREIGEQVGLASPSTVHAHLATLERVGLIRRDPTKPRAIELTGPPARRAAAADGRRRGCRCSVASPPAAPLLAEENVEDVDRRARAARREARTSCSRCTATRWSRPGSSTATRSSCSARDDARNGEIVVALAGDDESADEATVKTFYREADGRIRLQPENAALEPIYADHVQILGKVVGVFRSLR